MKNKVATSIISIGTALCICFQSSIAVFANQADEYVESQEFLAENYEDYTINLASTDESLAIYEMDEVDLIGENQENVLRAKEYVKSLRLEDTGNGHIEESCLSLLDEYYKDEDSVLTSFTVYVPKTRAAETTYGTYNGRTFTTSTFAGAVKNYQKMKDTNTRKMQAWFNGTTNFALLWGGSVALSVGVGAIQALSSIPASYQVKTGAFMETYLTVNPTCRGFYTIDTEGKYGNDKKAKVRVYTDEKGTYKPYVVWHPCDNSLPYGAYSPAAVTKNSQTDNYNNKSFNLKQCDSAYRYGASIVDRLANKAMSYEWQ